MESRARRRSDEMAGSAADACWDAICSRYPMLMPTYVHLVRHGEVENPHNIWYGRMEGFELSERGHRQAKALGLYFASRKIQALYCSPLVRALQTAAPLSQATGVEIEKDEQIIECFTRLEGKPGDWRMFRNPLYLRYFVLPSRPSWGEPYREIRERVSAAIQRMASEHEEGEVIAVSHMTPILIGRLWAEKNPRPPWRAGLRCAQASVTTLEFEGDQIAATSYVEVGAGVL